MSESDKKFDEVYVSVDIEATGPIPGKYSMISLGAVAFSPDGEEISSFEVNIEELEGSARDPDTMVFWEQNKAGWEYAMQNRVSPKIAMTEFSAWLVSLPCKHPIFVGYPLGFDFTFVYWYLHMFTGSSPFTFSGIDMKTFAMAILGTDYRGTVQRKFPKEWQVSSDESDKHFALADARRQGITFMNILKSSRLSTPAKLQDDELIESILGVLGPHDKSLDDMLIDAVESAKSFDTVKSPVATALKSVTSQIARVVHYLKMLDERPMTGPLPKKPVVKNDPKKGVLDKRAISAGVITRDLKPGDEAPIACHICFGKMSVKQTRDRKRWFMGCDNFSKTGCKGAVSYLNFGDEDDKQQ